MKVLVCGGRDYVDDPPILKQELDALHASRRGPITLIIHGGASGADTLGGMWAKENKVPMLVFYADWKTHGKAAGPIRNQRMLQDGGIDLVIACPGGRGTDDMIRRATKIGLKAIML